MNYPKHEFKIIRIANKDNLSGKGKGIATFKNYRAYLDKIESFELIADDWNALRGIKFEFTYDYNYNGGVKKIYKDEFGRVVKVKKIN